MKIVQFALLVCGLVGFSACGSSPASPTVSSPVVPQITYPSLIGGWSGSTSITAQQVANNIRATNICTSTWIVNSQNSNVLSGTFQLSGGTIVSCAQSGTFNGAVTSSGVLQLSYASTSSSITGCSYLNGDTGFTGVATAATITAQQSARYNCSGIVTDQIVTLSLTKR